MNAIEQMSPSSDHICTSVVLETSARTLGQVINGWIQLLLGLVGLGVTLHVFSIPTLKAGKTA